MTKDEFRNLNEGDYILYHDGMFEVVYKLMHWNNRYNEWEARRYKDTGYKGKAYVGTRAYLNVSWAGHCEILPLYNSPLYKAMSELEEE